METETGGSLEGVDEADRENCGEKQQEERSIRDVVWKSSAVETSLSI